MHNLPNMHLLINGECDIFTSRKTVLYVRDTWVYHVVVFIFLTIATIEIFIPLQLPIDNTCQ